MTTADDFGAWARPHWPSMVRLARRLSAVSGSGGSVAADWEDVLQEALGAAWRKWDQYDAQRGTPRSWLLAIVADQAHKGGRRRRPEPVDLQGVERQQDAGLVRTAAGRPLSGAEGAAVSALDVERALARLTQRQRLTVELHYFVDLPVAECAAVLGCSEGTVKSTLSDARGRLRAELGEDYR